MNWELINKRIQEGYIREGFKDGTSLRILNYTPKAQYEWVWDEATMNCRGLIVDEFNNVVARPFKKFFSADQIDFEPPDEPFKVFEKMDGSLGILYWDSGVPFIATRGSFHSEQALEGTKILRDSYSHVKFDKALTYMFEIIYPSNRIVVDYKSRRDLVLLGAVDTGTGFDIEVDIDMPRAACFDGECYRNFHNLASLASDNREGFVVVYESGLRLKVKFEEYKRLHKILTGVSPRSVWEMMKNDESLDSLIESTPDDFHGWVKETSSAITRNYQQIESFAMSEMKEFHSRREAAEYFKNCQYPSIMFSILDGKDYSQLIWKMIKPDSGNEFKSVFV